MRFRTEAALIALLIVAPAWGQAGTVSPSSFPARPAARSGETAATQRRRSVAAPTPTPADDAALAGQIDYRDAATAPAMSDGGPPPELRQSGGPTATSGSARFDDVGRIGAWRGRPTGAAVVLAHPTLPPGSYVEITALDTGRTIAALVATTGGSGVGDLSPGGLAQLGIAAGAPVRVRAATPPPPDQQALRAGQPAGARMSAPSALLVALRQQLATRGGRPAATPTSPPAAHPAARPPTTAAQPGASYRRPDQAAVSSPRPRPMPPPTPASTRPAVAHPAPAHGGFFVQVAALSSADRARALIGQLGGGRVVPAGHVFRVQAGPYADAAAAAHARDAIARRGYAGARVVADH